MRSIFRGLALLDAKTVSGILRLRHAYAMPWPKLPADAQTKPRSVATSSCSRKSVPRPLKERIGLTDSTLSTVDTPSRLLSGSQSYCGEWRKTGSMTLAARLIRSTETEASIARRISIIGSPPPARDASRPGPPPPAGGGGKAQTSKKRRRPGGSQGGAIDVHLIERPPPVKSYGRTCKNTIICPESTDGQADDHLRMHRLRRREPSL